MSAPIRSGSKPSWDRWFLRTSLRTSVFCAVGYAISQPVQLVVLSAIFRRPAAIATFAGWVRFEQAEFVLGSFVGWAFFHTRQWGRGSWRRTWADWAFSAMAMNATLQGKLLATTPAIQWIGVAVVSSCVTGAIFASAIGVIRRLARVPPAPAYDEQASAVFD